MYFLILLATLGSLAPLFDQYQSLVWYEAVKALFTQSDLTTFLALIGGLLLSVTLLTALDFIISHVTSKTLDLIPEGESAVSFLAEKSEALSEVQDQAEMQYLLSLLKKAQQR